MTEALYDRLADRLGKAGGPVPAIKSPEFDALLEELFQSQEAELVCQMPTKPVTAEALAKQVVDIDPGQVEGLLETLADNGIIFCRDVGGTRQYSVMPLIPGIFEIQFTKGEVNDRNYRLARLFDDYFKLMNDKVMKPLEESGVKIEAVPFARVIPVEKEIAAPDLVIHPFDRVSEFIEQSEAISVSTCYCRHHGELVGNPCEKSKEVCMSFGPQAKYIADRGFGRPISKTEAREVLDLAEEEGLIHCSSNTSNYITFICNCCDCHCGIIQSLKKGVMPMSASSAFMVAIDENKCSLCGTCEDRCQMDALVLGDESAELTVDLCIGCGLCVSTCDDEALSMVVREDVLRPPGSTRELNKAMAGATS
ncbi:MAG: hypothetical protein GY866_09595 [Proteobacteria bacterium]|nr:hypothetical protein [Pseudomonadota bacterium]